MKKTRKIAARIVAHFKAFATPPAEEIEAELIEHSPEDILDPDFTTSNSKNIAIH